MNFLEKNLEDIIYNNLSELEGRGLDIFRPEPGSLIVRRQVQLGNYGIADLITVEIRTYKKQRCLYINIIELKAGTVDLNAYQQVQRYKTAVNQILERFDLTRTHVEVRTTLIGSEITTSGDFVFVLNNDPDCEIYIYNYDFDGIWFNRESKGWKLQIENLPIDSIGAIISKSYKQYQREQNIQF